MHTVEAFQSGFGEKPKDSNACAPIRSWCIQIKQESVENTLHQTVLGARPVRGLMCLESSLCHHHNHHPHRHRHPHPHPHPHPHNHH